jgi:hypothetical protein
VCVFPLFFGCRLLFCSGVFLLSRGDNLHSLFKMMRKYSSRFATLSICVYIYIYIYTEISIDSFTDSLEFGTVKLLRFSCFAAFIATGEFSLFLLRGSGVCVEIAIIFGVFLLLFLRCFL